jgi:hypothetical protein
VLDPGVVAAGVFEGEAFSSGVEVAMSGKVFSAQACLLKIV